MEQMNWTEIILGVFTLLSTCGWFVSGRKHRQEVEGLKADVRRKDMDRILKLLTSIVKTMNQKVKGK